MEHRMDQVHHLVESIDLILKKAVIENPDIDARVKDDFFLHSLDLLKIKTSSVFQGRLCKLKI